MKNAPLSPLEIQLDAPSADPTNLSGTRLLDRYRIDQQIGQGGMALVYAGRHLALDLEVAIKVLRQRFAQRQSVVDRFLQEARAASRVRHPHIVEVTDFGSTPDGLVFMVMERLEGETLAATIEREGRLPWPRVRAIALQLCDAMQTTHDAGIVHRDVSLKNFFRLSRGKNPDFVKVLDFGIARMTTNDDSSPTGTVRRLTSDTQIMGTPEFMSPEQATRSGSVDARSDIYAMGVVLYAMLTAKLPFEAHTAIDMMAKHIYEPVPPPSQHEPDLARAIEQVVLRALEKDPHNRFQSMAALGHALAQIPDDARRSPGDSAETMQVATLGTRAPRKRWGPVRRFTMIGVAAGLAWWGWQDSGRFAEEAAALELRGLETLDSMALPAPVGSVSDPEALEVAAPELAAPLGASPTIAASPLPPTPAAGLGPTSAIPMSLPPAPPSDWLEHSRPKRKKARPPATAPVEASADEAMPEPEPKPELEPTPVDPQPAIEATPDPALAVPEPPTQFEPIDEVKDPFIRP
jgi:serine/threonine-protein kinase